jgi:hypothetical protein
VRAGAANPGPHHFSVLGQSNTEALLVRAGERPVTGDQNFHGAARGRAGPALRLSQLGTGVGYVSTRTAFEVASSPGRKPWGEEAVHRRRGVVGGQFCRPL